MAGKARESMSEEFESLGFWLHDMVATGSARERSYAAGHLVEVMYRVQHRVPENLRPMWEWAENWCGNVGAGCNNDVCLAGKIDAVIRCSFGRDFDVKKGEENGE